MDVRPDRSGTVYACRLGEQTKEFIVAVEDAALDPFRGYANAICDQLPEAVAVLDPFHVVRMGAGPARARSASLLRVNVGDG